MDEQKPTYQELQEKLARAEQVISALRHDGYDRMQGGNGQEGLNGNQDPFFGAFHSSPSLNAIFSLNNLQIIEVNQAMCLASGYTREEMLNKTAMDADFWYDPVQKYTLLKELIEKGILSNQEIRLRAKNGEIRLFNADITILTLKKMPYIYVSMVDITEQKKAEEALIASEERFRASLDNMMEGCQIIDRDWRYIYINDASARQGHYHKEDFLGHTLMETVPDLEKSEVYPVLKKSMEQRASARIEFECVLIDGDRCWFDLSVQPVPEGIFVFSLDITERRKMENGLRFHASLVESVSDAIISSDADYKILSWNKAAEEMYGWRAEEVIGRPVMDITKSVLVSETPEKIREALDRDNHWRGEAVHERKNGDKINVMISVSLMRDNNGKEIGAVTTFKDITERHKAETAIHQSEERFRRIFQAGPLGIGLSDLDYKFIMVNSRFCRLYGYSENELVGRTFRDISFPEDVSKDTPNLQKLVSGEFTYYNTEKRYKKKNGGVFWGSLTVTLIRDNDGKPQGFLAMVEDITPRKQSEERINHLNLALRSIRNVDQLITREKDRDRLIQGICDSLVSSGSFENAWIVLTDEACRPVNWAQSKNSNFPRIDLLKLKELPSCAQKALKQNKVIVIEDPYKQCQGCPIIGEKREVGSITVKLESEGEIYGVLCASMPRRLLFGEDEKSLLDEVADDIAFALRDISLGAAKELLQQEQQRAAKLESIGTLAGGIAHDFNNLLTGIIGNIGLAKSFLPPDGSVYEVLDEAEKAAARSRNLTQQLLTFARGGAPIKKIINAVNIIKDSAAFALRGSKVKLELSLPDDLWLIEADEGQIGQVIHNLVINADEAMPGGGTLHITAGNLKLSKAGRLPLPAGNYIEIDVKDTGTGISPEHLQKIFEPYFTTRHQGSGLGLTSAYSIIKSHSGALLAESTLDQGSTFRIYLPASKKTAKGEKKVAAKQSTQAGGKVLVMDDDEVIRKMLKNMLNLAGFEVEVTADGAEALEKYKQSLAANNPFSAVIMDLTVPGGMGGKEAIKALLEIDPKAAAIVSSGYATDPIMSEYKKYGFSAVIAKPYSIKQLQETITGLISKKKK